MSEGPTLAAALLAHPVFGALNADARADLERRFTCEMLPDGSLVAAGVALDERLGWLLSGTLAAERDTEPGAAAEAGARGGHAAQGAGAGASVPLSPGALFGAGAAPVGPADGWQPSPGAAASRGWRVRCCADSRVAFLPAAELAALREVHPALAFHLGRPAIAAAARTVPQPDLGLLGAAVRELLKRAPVTLSPDATIAEAAQRMRDARVSAVMLCEGDRLVGILTDRDLRNRVVAAGADPLAPVRTVATPAPRTLDAARPAFEALLLMTRHNIHHVPVQDGARVVGLLSAGDVHEHQGDSPVHLAGEIHRQTALPGLVAAAARVRPLQRRLSAAGASAYSTGHIVTAVTDAISVRLLQLAEAELGPAPLPYAWVAAGSQARQEQTARSDQDNCMVLDDAYDAAVHGAYFKALAERVNQGLDACGYVLCPGDMMARTDTWRQPQRRWAEYFHRWTSEPEPTALMLTSVFFDLRLIHGEARLLDDLRRDVLARTRANRLFLAHLVGNALTRRPPLSLFGGIATVRAGALRDAVDLKHHGIVPIVDLARVYALAGGHAAVNTQDRLALAAESHEISVQGARDLGDALEFLATLRLRHQAAQIAQGQPADHMLSLGTLGNFERGQLKDAFAVVQTLQNVLQQRYR